MIQKKVMDKLQDFKKRSTWFEKYRIKNGLFWPNEEHGEREEVLLSLIPKDRLVFLLERILNEAEFLSPTGIRALSKFHEENPYTVNFNGNDYTINYDPGDSTSDFFGGNSNWRGPVWMPVNALIIRALLNLYSFYGDDFKVECPTGSGQHMTLFEVAQELARRIAGTFLRGADGRRPVYGGTAKFQDDPHWRDLLQFFEYFHGDNGAGLGASHQTGWTGLVALMLDLFGRVDAKAVLETERERLTDRLMKEQVGGKQTT